MRIGEIKAQALMLMYPDTPIRFDDSDDKSVENAIYELKCNPSLAGLLESATGSINRALGIIEAAGLSALKYQEISASACDVRGDGRIVIRPAADLLYVDSVTCRYGGKTYVCQYEMSGEHLITNPTRGIITIVYRAKIPRVCSVTSDSHRLPLPRAVCELIPYYIKGELMSQENEEEARLSRQHFEKCIEDLASVLSACPQRISTIYSME